jgi:hypothetical protein
VRVIWNVQNAELLNVMEDGKCGCQWALKVELDVGILEKHYTDNFK